MTTGLLKLNLGSLPTFRVCVLAYACVRGQMLPDLTCSIDPTVGLGSSQDLARSFNRAPDDWAKRCTSVDGDQKFRG